MRHRNQREPDYRYHSNELYDYLTARLFKERLSQHDTYKIIFSKRGKYDRTDSLHQIVKTAQTGLSIQQNMSEDVVIQVSDATPKEHAGLQAVDYFVWALQRLYERGEDRYLVYLWETFRFVHDIDDTRDSTQGVYYTQKNPLTASVLKDRK